MCNMYKVVFFNLRKGVKYICTFSIVFERNLEKDKPETNLNGYL